MVTKLENILEGMKSFVQTALYIREKYLVRVEDFTCQRTMDFNTLCFF